MPEQIDIPASFPDVADVTGKRVVITGAGRGFCSGLDASVLAATTESADRFGVRP